MRRPALALVLPLVLGPLGLVAPPVSAGVCALDPDGNAAVDALTDGLLVIRYLFGFGGTALTSGALAADATRTDPAAVAAYIEAHKSALDADANGASDALTDGLLVIRYLFGFRGTALVNGALAPNATRTDPTAVAAYIEGLTDCSVAPSFLLNDTGIPWCANANTRDLVCPVEGFPRQDGEYGRDATANDDSDGHAGFSFTKLDANGNPLLASAASWSCVRDNVTGLVWELKTDDGGLRDQDWTYTWYDDVHNYYGNPGAIGTTGTCGNTLGGQPCNTQTYAAAVRASNLCGFGDWRMPTVKELEGIGDLGRSLSPLIDPAYFPDTVGWYYWSGSPSAYSSGHAWYVQFGNGEVGIGGRDGADRVRLVRSGP